MKRYGTLRQVSDDVVGCRLCPRLVDFREGVRVRRAFEGQEYWRRPVPGFGDPDAWLVIIGLAPAAHGGNRTGRVFTGDESGRFLMEALHEAGLANKPASVYRGDGLRLEGCYITAAVKCVPPDNKPTPEEFLACSGYLDAELRLLGNARAALALGQMAFRSYMDYVRRAGKDVRGVRFAHGASYRTDGLPVAYASYHPTPRNTYTKKLTKKMLVDLLHRIKAAHCSATG